MVSHNLKIAVSLIAAVALALVGSTTPTQTANLATYPTAAFTFDDSSSNGTHVWSLWSDGLGIYAYGKDGLGGTIDAEFTLGGSLPNVNLNLVKSRRKFNGRYMFVQCVFVNCTPLGTLDPATNTYSGSFSDGWWLTAWRIDAMANTETRLTQGQFAYGGASTNPSQGPSYPRYSFNWCGGAPQTAQKSVCTGRDGDGSGMLVATRNDVNHVATWVITADAVTTAGGDIAEALEQASSTSGLTSRGLYRAPFKVTVQCLKGCSNLLYPPQ